MPWPCWPAATKQYLPLLQQEARWAADFSAESFATWYYGYIMTFLAEYVTATGDQSVMPGLERLANEAARGQSAVGTWGHKFALPTGSLNGYGCMNQPGLSLCIGMALAREAGVKDPVLDRAIAKAASFVRWYVNKGAVPYGDHQPFPAHEDNGKCSSAAVLFDLLGDRRQRSFLRKCRPPPTANVSAGTPETTLTCCGRCPASRAAARWPRAPI